MSNQSVLVTGAGRGVGHALAAAFAGRGWTVYAGLRDGHGEAPAGTIPLELDINDDQAVAAAVRSVEARCGGLDCLVNNAAILGPLDDALDPSLDFAAMRAVIDTNALGTLRLMHAFWPLMSGSRGKLIVNISSEAGSIGQAGRTGWFGYCMSKSAANMASVLFHNAIRPAGGRVMVVHPGWVRTWMRGHLDADATLSPEESAAAILALVETRGAESHPQPLYLDWKGEPLPW